MSSTTVTKTALDMPTTATKTNIKMSADQTTTQPTVELSHTRSQAPFPVQKRCLGPTIILRVHGTSKGSFRQTIHQRTVGASLVLSRILLEATTSKNKVINLDSFSYAAVPNAETSKFLEKIVSCLYTDTYTIEDLGSGDVLNLNNARCLLIGTKCDIPSMRRTAFENLIAVKYWSLHQSNLLDIAELVFSQEGLYTDFKCWFFGVQSYMNARNTSKDIKERVRKLVEKGGPLGKSLETTFKMMMWKNGLGYKDEEIEEDELEALKRKVESAWKGNPKFLEGSEGRYV